jgi:hypothetical protein
MGGNQADTVSVNQQNKPSSMFSDSPQKEKGGKGEEAAVKNGSKEHILGRTRERPRRIEAHFHQLAYMMACNQSSNEPRTSDDVFRVHQGSNNDNKRLRALSFHGIRPARVMNGYSIILDQCTVLPTIATRNPH